MIEGFRDTVLERKMTRKEFVSYMFGAVLAVFGVHNLLSYLLQNKGTSHPAANDDHNGFGSRKFGI